MSTLVLIEYHYNSDSRTINTDSLAAIDAAKQLGAPVHALLLGAGVTKLAHEIAVLAGVEKVLCLDDNYVKQLLPERVAPIMADLARTSDYRHLLASATGVGKNIMPRVAALLDVMQVSEVTEIISDDTFAHFIYAGSVVETVQSRQPRHVLTVRATHFDKACPRQDSGEIVMLSMDGIDKSPEILSQCVSVNNSAVDGEIDLTTAKIVVAGGGGFCSVAEFDGLLKPLAKALDAAVAASKMPIANGFCSSDYLIGQTGRAIAPQLYLAVGISGANQHVAGMKESQTIIAINSDAGAPIFDYADYGFVGDLKTVLPQLTQLLVGE